MVVIRVYPVKLHTVVVVVDMHTITMIVNTVVMVVPVVVFPGTVPLVEITLVVRAFLVRVIAGGGLPTGTSHYSGGGGGAGEAGTSATSRTHTVVTV